MSDIPLDDQSEETVILARIDAQIKRMKETGERPKITRSDFDDMAKLMDYFGDDTGHQ